MIEPAPRNLSPIARFGGQPIAIAAAALVIVVLGASSIALWRAFTGSAPESDRVVATRQLQARATQASEQLVEKTKGLEATQQESIDQLQVVQDQLLTMRRLLAAQQADTRKPHGAAQRCCITHLPSRRAGSWLGIPPVVGKR